MNGFAAIKAAKQAADRARASMETRDVVLRNDGDEAVLWFVGSSEEPLVRKYHTFRRTQNGRDRYYFEICGQDFEGHAGCVFCWARQNGDQSVGRASNSFLFSVIDTRFVHKIPKASDSGFQRFEWIECPVDGDMPDGTECKHCRRKVPRECRGASRLRLGIQVAGGLDGLNDRLARKCVSCGGKLKYDGFTNGKRVIQDLDDVSNPSQWRPVIKCRKCTDPVPGSIRLAPITMRRSGVGKSTSYNFSEGAFSDPPEWVQRIEVPDLSAGLEPRMAQEQAELLGVRNPFGGGAKRGSVSYQDEDGDDVGSDDIDDD